MSHASDHNSKKQTKKQTKKRTKKMQTQPDEFCRCPECGRVGVGHKPCFIRNENSAKKFHMDETSNLHLCEWKTIANLMADACRKSVWRGCKECGIAHQSVACAPNKTASEGNRCNRCTKFNGGKKCRGQTCTPNEPTINPAQNAIDRQKRIDAKVEIILKEIKEEKAAAAKREKDMVAAVKAAEAAVKANTAASKANAATLKASAATLEKATAENKLLLTLQTKQIEENTLRLVHMTTMMGVLADRLLNGSNTPQLSGPTTQLLLEVKDEVEAEAKDEAKAAKADEADEADEAVEAKVEAKVEADEADEADEAK